MKKNIINNSESIIKALFSKVQLKKSLKPFDTIEKMMNLSRITIISVCIFVITNCSSKVETQDNSELLFYLVTQKYYTPELANYELGYSISSMHDTLYNSLLAGNSTLANNIALALGGIEGNCSLGGKVILTGSTSTTNSTTKANLKYAFTGCKQIVTSNTMSTTLTLDGNSTYDGFINSSITVASKSFKYAGVQSNSNYILGTPIDHSATCEISITNSSTISGSICGTSFTKPTTTSN